MPTRRVIVTHIKKILKKGDWLTALLYVSADLEYNLFGKLFLEKNFDPQKIEKTPLGELIKLGVKKRIIVHKSDLLERFLRFRNRAVHERSFARKIDLDSEARDYAIKLINDVIAYNRKFIVKTTIDDEKRHNDYLNKKREINSDKKWYF
jgi:hypothetical protein